MASAGTLAAAVRSDLSHLRNGRAARAGAAIFVEAPDVNKKGIAIAIPFCIPGGVTSDASGGDASPNADGANPNDDDASGHRHASAPARA